MGSGAVERRILQHLHDRKTRAHLSEIHAHFLRHHLHQSNQIVSHFVSVCASFNKMPYARLIFNHTHNPNILVFNSMIKGYSLSKPFDASIHLFSLMRSRGIRPDEFTFAPLFKSCSNLSDLNLGKAVHGEVISLGFESFNSIRIGIVELYAGCGKMDDARNVFDEMPHRDVILWNLMIRGFSKVGDVDTGFRLFKQMKERSIVSWNSMISSLAKSKRDKDALQLFHKMQADGFEPDEATVVTILPVCARLGEDRVGQWLHSYAKSKKFYQNFITVGNSLLDFYCKRGFLESAFAIFNNMPRKNVVSWNTMISGMAKNGEGEKGVALFEEMINTNVTPNEATFVGVLTCCVHAGLVQRGKDLFYSMSWSNCMKPKLEHYGCMIDLLGRNGRIREARELIQSMPMKPNAALWGALLSSCRIHCDTDLAEFAAKELIKLEPWNSGNYVLLSNIYADNGKWDQVENVRISMKENCIKKAPGQSLVV